MIGRGTKENAPSIGTGRNKKRNDSNVEYGLIHRGVKGPKLSQSGSRDPWHLSPMDFRNLDAVPY